MQAEISWFTPPVGDGVGYGYAAIETIRGLQDHDVKVSYNTEEPLVHISFVQPDFYQGIPDQYRIGYTPWESTVIPDRWMAHMLRMDEIWTTSQWCKEIFDGYGVNDIVKVIPHGIDPDIWYINDRYEGEKFYFLHVGGPTERKGGQKVVDAFLELFDGDEHYQLILKSHGPSETRYYDKRNSFGPATRHPQIQGIEQTVSTGQLASLFQKANCLVYPTNGEGFGLIPFQAIATGLPTIVTDATGCTEYSQMSVPLKSTPTKGMGIHLGEWAEPDKEHLVECMKMVADDYNDIKNKTLNSAKIIHETRTWGKIAEMIIDELGDKIYHKV